MTMQIDLLQRALADMGHSVPTERLAAALRAAGLELSGGARVFAERHLAHVADLSLEIVNHVG